MWCQFNSQQSFLESLVGNGKLSPDGTWLPRWHNDAGCIPPTTTTTTSAAGGCQSNGARRPHLSGITSSRDDVIVVVYSQSEVGSVPKWISLMAIWCLLTYIRHLTHTHVCISVQDTTGILYLLLQIVAINNRPHPTILHLSHMLTILLRSVLMRYLSLISQIYYIPIYLRFILVHLKSHWSGNVASISEEYSEFSVLTVLFTPCTCVWFSVPS